MSELRLSYKDGPGGALPVDVIHRWKRGDLPAPVMSASSGPKDYIENQIWSVFHADAEVESVAMVRGNGPAFIIIQKGGHWFDVAQKELEARKYPPGGQKEGK